ncbi:MAG: hypothetical protein PSU94_15095, partial [Lacunisphaera sp.]|nr:hypothetical protein [Lacunisphaera sp.]
QATPLQNKTIPGWVWGTLAAGVIGAGAFFALRPSAPVAGPPPVAVTPPAAKPAPELPRAKSVAVLPFTNMSEEKDSAFFADGMHEDILTNLALVRDLKVVSRTSVMEYRSTTKKIRQIAQELGVAYILEGSVRRVGSKVRVTGQLINAATDEHVWAKSYDRDITDIFAIQSELSQAIAAALSAALSPQEKSLIERRPTDNLAAYDLYLKGRAFFVGTRTDMSRAQAEAALAEAVQLDPNFAQAWGYLAAIHGLAVFGDEDRSAERLAKAKAAIDTAVRLAPGDPDVIEMQGSYFYYGYRDYARAAEHYQRVLLVKPNSGDLYTMIGFIMRRQGHWADTLANLRHAQELDPRNLNTLFGLGHTLEGLRRYDEAAVAYRRLAEIAPDDPFQTGVFPYVEFLKNGSIAAFDQWQATQKPTVIGASKMLFIRRAVLALHGDWAALVKLDQEHPYADPYDDVRWSRDAAMIFNLVGNNDLSAARAWAEKLIPTLQGLLKQQPANASLWSSLASLHALLGEKEPALSAARKAVELVPVSSDAMIGPNHSRGLAQVLAWAGDKEAALAELARLLRTPFGSNVHLMRINPGWKPLWGDPRFEALLNDPKNNAPLF